MTIINKQQLNLPTSIQDAIIGPTQCLNDIHRFEAVRYEMALEHCMRIA